MVICDEIYITSGPTMVTIEINIKWRFVASVGVGVARMKLCGLLFLNISLKMLQSDRLVKCKDIVIMTLLGAKTIFLDT